MDSISRACNEPVLVKKFSENLDTEFIGKNIIFFPRVKSTNLIAKKEGENMQNGTVLLADYQSAGRGRRNKEWFSPGGQGLWISIIIKNPDIKLNILPVVNILLSVVITKSIINISNKQIKIKWPNDLIYNNKKVCGLLSETFKISQHTILISGIGVNTGKNILFPEEISLKAGSIELEGDRQRELLLKDILETFERSYKLLIKSDFQKILKEYKEYSLTLNKNIEIIEPEGIRIPARVIDIGSYGELVVKTFNGQRRNIYTGEEILQKINAGAS
ncbi:MAG TPA: biotin--[acetyl-CoA-carboxylase] ligase [Candidatus Eremiobacteraeota bacterium]|nr:MAG: Bifunctional ligase/repressor BirA [bacterium ADurb.Bin363]HPZ08715.1 biotin--[acetyl-CoA-carboxylase] ligase [Candidatus Eremiobacteraeota bacterium]